jgi:acetyl-CoA carboxylase biotin carboxyl carrier protein
MAEYEHQREDERRVDNQALEQMLAAAKDLARALEGTATTRIRLRAGEYELELVRHEAATDATLMPSVPGTPASQAAAHDQEKLPPGRITVCAPLVGVFYRAESPGARPLVEIGDTVEPGQVVGIIEAMKVMNQVTAEHGGTVAEILAENGTTVHYQQPLLSIDTSPRKG